MPLFLVKIMTGNADYLPLNKWYQSFNNPIRDSTIVVHTPEWVEHIQDNTNKQFLSRTHIWKYGYRLTDNISKSMLNGAQDISSS